MSHERREWVAHDPSVCFADTSPAKLGRNMKRQRPLNLPGLRFSVKARAASWKSSLR